jgi:arylsulfatase A-like enzyme
MTDDQRWDSLWAMPFVNRTLRPLSLDFRHSYVTTPECCPARASLLSGGFYAHNTGVLGNDGPNGGAKRFVDADSLALKLHRAGYKTALIGKYMNGYDEITPRVPPGWSRFVGTVRSGDWSSFTMVIGKSGGSAGTGRIVELEGHIVEFEFDEAQRFLESIDDQPFFLLVTPQAPHKPASPQPQDVRLHGAYTYRKRSWGEDDLSDKPRYVRRRARRFDRKTAVSDEFHRDQLRTLRSVDRGVEALHQQLADSGELESTVFIFTSDNGYLWGEHRLEGKNLPYDESIRVPMMVSLPGALTGRDDHLVAMNLDVGATVLDLAGIYPSARGLARHTDGLSLRPLLEGTALADAEWRSDLLVQSFTRGFAALLTRQSLGDARRPSRSGWNWKYVEHQGGNPKEAYRSDVDPFETDSVDKSAEFRALYREPLADRLHELMGLYMVTDGLPAGRVGQAYHKELNAVGAAQPYTWAIVDGRPPRGMRLHRRRGTLSGTPEEKGEFELSIRVEASTVARYVRQPQGFTRKLRLKIKE